MRIEIDPVVYKLSAGVVWLLVCWGIAKWKARKKPDYVYLVRPKKG
jgi:hypothetical protein